MMADRPYVGRFAPSPTGRLHMGSLVAAVASFLDARCHGGTWLVRIEDLDPPREVPGATSDILRTLEGHGLTWDGPVMHQSNRDHVYAKVLEDMLKKDLAYGCICTRKQLAAADGLTTYPGTCRTGLPEGTPPRSIRFKMPAGEDIVWKDRFAGMQAISRSQIGDVILRRADGYWAYHLAVVVDDMSQGVTDIVRGADLLDSSAVHLAIQLALAATLPRYGHVPVLRNADGQKLSKQTMAEPIEISHASTSLKKSLQHLGLDVSEDHPASMLLEAQDQWLHAIKRLD